MVPERGRDAAGLKYNGAPVSLQLPQYVELAVVSTELGLRGDTAAGGATKQATLETGLVARVPLFIKEGEMFASTPKPAKWPAGRDGSSLRFASPESTSPRSGRKRKAWGGAQRNPRLTTIFNIQASPRSGRNLIIECSVARFAGC